MLTITAPLGFANEPTNHLVYTMVDSLEQISEGDETNNLSSPLTINNVTPISPYIMLQPNCAAGPDVQFQVIGADWPSSEAINLYWENALENSITPPHSGSFNQTWTKPGLSDGVYEVRVSSASFTATAVFTAPCPAPPNSITINGPTQGFIGQSYPFTATISPITATLPLTYTWETTGQTAVTHTATLSDTIAYTWVVTGTQTITVTTHNAVGGPVIMTHTIEIKPRLYYLPILLNSSGGMIEKVGLRP